MKWLGLLALLLVALVVADESSGHDDENDVLELADRCDEETCVPPNCRCSSVNIPGGLAPRDTPQFVLITFDDGVNVGNMETYRSILIGRRNSNGCSAGATFYVNHEYTNYQLVNELYNNGYEIALHSMSHRNDQSYWSQATFEDMLREFGDQRVQMSYFGNIPVEEIKGVRIPFLQMTGNASFQAIADVGLTYDASWPTTAFIDPGLWPYTLDYASTQDCIIPPCPTASIPGAWVLPILSWVDQQGSFCSLVDACFPDFRPDANDEEGWYRFILGNFERSYQGNRAPFGYYVHESFLQTHPGARAALVRFMNLINNLNDAFMVTSAEVIDWVKSPVPVDQYKTQPCRSFQGSTCQARTCSLFAEHNQVTYWPTICRSCPRVYPWLGNPLGE